MAQTFNPNTQEAAAGRSLNQSQPVLQSELQDIWEYREKPCFENIKQTNKNI